VVENADAIAEGSVSYTDLAETILTNINVQLCLLISLILSIALIWLMRRHAWKTESFCALKPGAGLNLPLCVLLGVAANIAILGILMITDAPSHFPSYEDVVKMLTGGPVWMQMLNVGILAPVAEELVFRGTVINILTKSAPGPDGERPAGKLFTPWAAAVISAAMFGLVHGNALQSLYAFVLGLVLGFVYIWLDSIWAVIALHMAFNCASFAMDLVPEYDVPGLIILAITIVASLGAGGLMLALYNRRPQTSATRPPEASLQ